jgi:hypothetical protein
MYGSGQAFRTTHHFLEIKAYYLIFLTITVVEKKSGSGSFRRRISGSPTEKALFAFMGGGSLMAAPSR